jgi:LPXTG-motif cell wall-anchored protein
VKLSLKKLRRSATLVGGSIAGLGVVAAMATPALACEPLLTYSNVCAHADGTWQIQWSVKASDKGISGEVGDVQLTPQDSTLTNIVKDAAVPVDDVLSGVQTLKKTDETAKIDLTVKFHLRGHDIFPSAHGDVVKKPSTLCKGEEQPPPPPNNGNPPPNDNPPPVKEDQPELIYDEDCTTLTVGVQLPKTWKQSETVTFKPSVGSSKTVTAKPGETKTVDFPASKNLSVTAIPKSSPKDTAKITYEAPKDCQSSSSPAAPKPSTSGPVLAITGSSSTPIAGGAIALVLVGGGAFFLARRRKMKFTA